MPRRPVRDLSILLVLAALTALLAPGHFALRIDLENAAMKAVGTVDAEVAARRSAEFGVDRTVVLMLEPLGVAARGDDAALELSAFVAALRADPGAREVRALPISDDGVLLVTVDVAADASGWAEPLRHLLAGAKAAAPPTHRLLTTGQPVGEIAIAEALAQEQQEIVPWIAAGLLLVLALVYRSLALALGAVVPAFMAILCVGGLQHALGATIDPVGSLLAPVLLTVGVAGAVHFLEKFLARRAQREDAAAAVRHAIGDLVVPASLTVATTVAGFAGLLTSPIPAVARFGATAAAGVVLTCMLTFAVLPPWLRLFAGGASVARRAAQRGPWRDLGAGLAASVRARAGVIVAAFAILTVAAAIAWTGLGVDTDPLRVLPKDHAVRLATQRVGARLGGTDTFELLLEPPQPPLAAGRVALLEAQLLGTPGIAGPAGPPRHGGHGAWLVPLLLAPAEVAARETTFAAAEASARAAGFATAHASGPAVRVARDSGRLVRGQLSGLAFTALCLFGAMALGFRSARLAALGLVPNLVPCVLLYGGLALGGRALSVGTAMIGTVMLGLVVDDTIHFLHGYRRARARGGAALTAVARTLRGSGRAILVTSLVLAVGFAACLLGELETTREFGVLASGTIVAALAADLVLLPALLLSARSARRWT